VSWQAFAWARQAGFEGVNVDLCYGLPEQTEVSMERTARAVAAGRPDRVALFGYAHVPVLKPLQRRIDAGTLPDVTLRLRLFQLARAALLAEGYRAVGIDHFALPGDPLVQALDEGRLHRNFQGYTTTTTDTLLGFGLSAISDFGGALAQDQRSLGGYLDAVDAGTLPTERGFTRTAEDRLRGEIIRQLMCTFALDVPAIEQRFGITFARRFAPEWAELERLEGEGLLSLSPEQVTLSPAGRLLARNVAVVFDAYRKGRPRGPAAAGAATHQFSSTI
jgi:oxygen-independent coproporphyrinogen III oxidase